ncbi:MAG: rhomboid family intramembrane serine protease [Elainellaceae cyanobacterium]
MVPLKDENPTRITPYVTYGLIAINVLAFLYEATLMGGPLEGFFHQWAVVPAELTASFQGIRGYSPVQEGVTLITSQFLHAGLLHLGGNMLYLWIFGNNVEEQMGRIRFLIFYLSCGVVASLAQWYFSMYSEIPSLGASGAIAGVMGAYIIRFPKVRILTLLPIFLFFTVLRIPAVFFLGIWFVQQALYGITSLGAPANIGMENGGIAYWAHAGGFVIGAALGPIFGLFTPPPSETEEQVL